MSARNRSLDQSDGFTLIELLLSISIILVVLGAISSALIVFLKNADYTVKRDDHSGGAALVSTYLDRDLASADTAAYSGSACSGTANVLLLTWGESLATPASPEPDSNGAGTYAAAYYLTVDASSVPAGGGTRYMLQRAYCFNGGAPSTTTLAYNLGSTADFDNVGSNACPAAGTAVTLTLKKYESDTGAADYRYTGCVKGRLR